MTASASYQSYPSLCVSAACALPEWAMSDMSDARSDARLKEPLVPVTGQTTPWRQALDAGQAALALTAYGQEDNPDDGTERSLGALADLQRELRGKDFRRAQRALSRLEDGGLVDAGGLTLELEVLEESAKALDRVKPEAALELLDRVSHPLLSAEAETQRGTAHIFMNEAERAKDHFDRAIALDPRHFRAITNRGNLALEAGRLDEAVAAYEEALTINHDFANALHNLGVAYRRQGQMGKSVEKIKAAQRMMRQRDREEARASLSSRRTTGAGGKWLRWALYGGAALGLYYLLQAQGIL